MVKRDTSKQYFTGLRRPTEDFTRMFWRGRTKDSENRVPLHMPKNVFNWWLLGLGYTDMETLDKVLEYLSHYKPTDYPMDFEPEQEERIVYEKVELADWQKEFFDGMDELLLIKLTCAANYLNIRSLYKALTKYLSTLCQGKTTDEIHRMLNPLHNGHAH